MTNTIAVTENKAVRKKHSQSQFVVTMNRLKKNKSAMLGLFIFIALIILAILAPYISPYGFAAMKMSEKLQGPSMKHWFGTDELGRDVLSRILYGGRYSLSVGVLATLTGLILGTIVGSIAGYYGGKVDNIIMRFLDIFQSIPSILLVIVFSAAMGAGFDKTIIALAISMIPDVARQMRASILRVRDEDYIEAADAIGCSTFRQITEYIIPNSFAPLLVWATMSVAGAILTTASLSYIGLGIQPPIPEWGAMLSGAKAYLRTNAYLLIFPGMFIAITVLGLNMFGDGLRDALDPKLKD